MKTRHLFFLSSLLIFFSCSPNHPKSESNAPVVEQPKIKEPLKIGEVISSVACGNDGSQSYALYLPKTYSDSVKFPVIIFFDPHASGSYPVGIYKSLADQFGYILMGSNNSKNGLQFDQSNAIVNSLMVEAAANYSSDKKGISLAGFSGGSKVALVAAANHPELLSVIYCGAAIPFDNIQQFPPALGFAGGRDLNYTEVMLSGPTLDSKKIVHDIIQWKGKHEWPDSLSFEDAFYWCSFTAMRNKTIGIDHALIKTFLQKKNKLIASGRTGLRQHDLYSHVVTFLRELADVSVYQLKLDALTQSGSYRKEMQKQQNILQTESILKQNYAQCFNTKDLNWWKEEIARMRSLKTGEQEMMYERLLGYLSLAAFSYSNNAIRQNNFSAAQQFLAIYQFADPGNPEQSFLTACMYARQGDGEKAVAALEEAIQLGLKDKSKIETEESFSSLHSNDAFNKLLSRL